MTSTIRNQRLRLSCLILGDGFVCHRCKEVPAACADPVGFVADLPERVILDEVQRAPGIFTALETAVDRRRTPGRFLLTGSANYDGETSASFGQDLHAVPIRALWETT